MRCRRLTETSSKPPKAESLSRVRTVGGTNPPDKAADTQVTSMGRGTGRVALAVGGATVRGRLATCS